VPIKNLDPKSPINSVFAGSGFKVADEIYMFRNDTALAGERHLLLALDTEKMKPEDLAKDKTKDGTPYRKDGVYAVSWIAPYGKGRNFYCSLGHRDEIYYNPVVLQHYLAGIQYALGDLEADATPTKPASGG
jgi:type 1 glutamine amidotransferase